MDAESTPQAVDIDFTGAKIAASGKLTSLSAKDTQATNTIDQPKAIAPVESTITLQGGRLRHTMPGYSVQFIELTQQ